MDAISAALAKMLATSGSSRSNVSWYGPSVNGLPNPSWLDLR